MLVCSVWFYGGPLCFGWFYVDNSFVPQGIRTEDKEAGTNAEA